MFNGAEIWSGTSGISLFLFFFAQNLFDSPEVDREYVDEDREWVTRLGAALW